MTQLHVYNTVIQINNRLIHAAIIFVWSYFDPTVVCQIGLLCSLCLYLTVWLAEVIMQI